MELFIDQNTQIIRADPYLFPGDSSSISVNVWSLSKLDLELEFIFVKDVHETILQKVS